MKIRNLSISDLKKEIADAKFMTIVFGIGFFSIAFIAFLFATVEPFVMMIVFLFFTLDLSADYNYYRLQLIIKSQNHGGK